MTPEQLRERAFSLATLPATRFGRRLAFAVVAVSAGTFAALAPYAAVPLAPVWPFIPVYQSALIVCDLATAFLLFGQFRFVHLHGLLTIACGYLFTAAMAATHLLTFPGLFSHTGRLGAGAQSTAWLYMFWHGGFPLCVIAYALLKHKAPPARADVPNGIAIAAGAAGAFAAAGGLTWLATAGQHLLPTIMQGHGYTPAMIVVISAVWGCSLLALVALWLRRPHTVLDVWLMVVMCAWLFDIALAAVLNAGRFDVGFYAGRIYGLLAACLVLLVLLAENSALYRRAMLGREQELKRARDSLAWHAERLRILREIERAVADGRDPQAIAAAVIRPLRELLGVPRAIVNRFDLAAGEVEWVAAAGRRAQTGPGVRHSIGLMGDLAALRRGEPQRIDVAALPPGPERDALLASGLNACMVVPMLAGGELLGALSFGAASGAFTREQIGIAEEVAAQLAIAMSQARLLGRVRSHAAELEATVRQRTAALQAANRELESFSYSVSHDLRAPLRAVDGYALMLEEDYSPVLDREGRRLLAVVRSEAKRMGQLIDDLLAFARTGTQRIDAVAVDMAALARTVAQDAAREYPAAVMHIDELPQANGDRALLQQVWANLIGNALKYSSKTAHPRIEVAGRANGAEHEYWVRDNGAGFDPRYADKLFGVFRRLHGENEFPGTGVGLAIVHRVVSRHGGRVWAEGKPGEGACFGFALPKAG